MEKVLRSFSTDISHRSKEQIVIYIVFIPKN